MRYIFINDLFRFFKENIKIIITYFMIIFASSYVRLLTDNFLNQDSFLDIIGLNFSLNGSIWQILFTCLNISFYIFLAIKVFENNLSSGAENIFLRMSKGKWYIYKVMSILIITFLVMFVCYLLMFIIYGYKINYGMIFIYNYIYFIFIEIFSILLYIFYYNFKKLFVIIFILLFLIIKYLIIDFRLINHYIFIIFGLFVFINIFIYLLIRFKKIDILK